MTLPWREIERELVDWARDEGMVLEQPSGSGDTWGNTTTELDEGMLLNLSSLARRLADTLTLRLVEPATPSPSVVSARLPSAESRGPLAESHAPDPAPKACESAPKAEGQEP